MDSLRMRPDESEVSYKKRIYLYKDVYGLTWQDIADIINKEFNTNYSADKYRKDAYRILDNDSVENIKLDEKLLDFKKEKVKLSDERIQVNALVRKLAREDSLKELAIEAVENISKKKYLDIPCKLFKESNTNKKAILCLGDWHYGLDVDSMFNVYNPDIAGFRINKLLNKVLSIIEEHNIDDLYVINLGDMISGRIHLPLRLNSRLDTVTQTMEVSEILAEFLNDLSQNTKVKYYSVEDNHSRVEPNKRDSFNPEAFSRIIDWYLRERLKDNDNIFFDETGKDIAEMYVFNHCIVAVHGDKDPQKGIVDRLNSYLQTHIDMIISAHMHHFSADENNNTEFYCNGSLIGQDDYAAGLRLNSLPSQLMFICTPDNFSEIIYKIKL